MANRKWAGDGEEDRHGESKMVCAPGRAVLGAVCSSSVGFVRISFFLTLLWLTRPSDAHQMGHFAFFQRHRLAADVVRFIANKKIFRG